MPEISAESDHTSGHLQKFGEAVAVTVAGPQGDDQSVAVDWTALIELVMQIVTSLLSDCSAHDSKVVKAIKAPSLFQRVRFRSLASKACNQCFTYRWRDQSGVIAEAMIQQAAGMSDADVAALVFEVRHDDWILV